MPHSSVRPEVILLITKVDFSRRDDLTRPYHRDGRPFTHAEHALLITCTPEEVAAAKTQSRLEAEWQRELGAMQDAFFDLLMKYFAKLPKGSMVSDAVAIMTDEDYAEFERLAEIVTAEDTLEYRALHEDN
ncbi:hypothetical protein [Streptomyces roseochromogenus]|uniref:Uncharacterized protein n=1 Tax=Streptomyces roseochromogenus subsp. oscitans DS 12.976 TaxID=1352936 RepID=V6KJR7_STRRC|nr:hypothetical protein [Streptomyces roseochromogenus]EST29219.1 hypothetical protein M878_20830 [Streptomyces roseochromogenus subsp. oscitans DS 12.976]